MNKMTNTREHIIASARAMDSFREISEEEKKALKKCLLEIYLDVSCVCEKYNLCIMLGGGSALGAVRHQGFIPWDDDLDALMPRKDYNVLKNIFEKELGDKYLLSVPNSNSNRESRTLFMQITRKDTAVVTVTDGDEHGNGVKIDVFAIENTPDNGLVRMVSGVILNLIRVIVLSIQIYKSNSSVYKSLFMKKTSTKIYYYIRRFVGMLFSIFSLQWLCDIYDNIASSGKGIKYCSIPTGRKWYHGETHERAIFFPPAMALFGGFSVKIPNNSDVYLTRLYGNYMELPPVEKRESHLLVKFIQNTKIVTIQSSKNA